MDEVLFRSGQKFENLQVQAEIVATKAKDVIVVYTQAGKSFLLRVWDSGPLLQIKDCLNEGATKLVTFLQTSKVKLLETVDLKGFYTTLVHVFSKKWTKRDIYFGCSGLMIGIAIGVAVGLTIKNREQIVKYMQAVQCPNYLGIESAIVVEDALAPYECGEFDIMVNVKAASVQLIDMEICNGYGKTLRGILGNMPKQGNHPVILGRDCTGIIVDVGRQVKRLDVGDEVWLAVPFWAQGTLCQTVLVQENKVARKPKNVGFEGASSLPYAGSWALAILSEAGINSETSYDKKILILGGCSPVGCVLIQLLRFWEASVTVSCYKRAVPVAEALGASHILKLNEPLLVNESFHDTEEKKSFRDDLLSQLELSGETYDLIIITKNDCGQGKDFTKFLNPNGQIYSTLPQTLFSDSCGFLIRFLLKCYISTTFFVQKLLKLPVNNFDETHLCYATLDRLTEFVENNQVQTVVDKIFHPQDIEMALHHIQSHQAIGSTIITFR